MPVQLPFGPVTLYTEFGKDYERIGTGGLWMKSQEISGALVNCDLPRAYNAVLRRTGKIRD